MYALLSAAGLMLIPRSGGFAVHVAAAVFCLTGAVFMWKRETSSPGSRLVFGLALLNPATASLWLGLSSMATAHPHGLVSTACWVFGVGIGTTTWFMLVALASSRAHRRFNPVQQLVLRRGFAAALAAAAVLLVL